VTDHQHPDNHHPDNQHLDPQHLDTLVIHAGQSKPRLAGAVVTPIVQSATFDFSGAHDGEALRYIRYHNTPNHEVLHARLAALENAEAALVVASGMAAIAAGLLSVLSAGDHVLVQDSLYGGTAALVDQDLARLGIDVERFDGRRAEQLEARLRPTTRAIYTEALSNPLVLVADHQAIIAFARQHGLVSMIDATFATPINFQPLDLGYDLALHSATKYLNGHSDIVAGVVAGQRERVAAAGTVMRHLGGALDPHACFLLERGLKTLALRMARHNANALAIARFLARHPAVRAVHHPGLEDHPDHARATRLFRGYGGVLAFDVGSDEAAARLLDRLRVMVVAPSLGGVETLVSRPKLTSHAGLDPQQRRQLGITDGLVRIAAGVEAPEDLIRDLEQALAS